MQEVRHFSFILCHNEPSACGREGLPPALFDFPAYVAEIIFIEMTTFQRNGISRLWIVVDIVVPAAPFELTATVVQLFDCCVPWKYYTEYIKIIRNDTQIFCASVWRGVCPSDKRWVREEAAAGYV